MALLVHMRNLHARTGVTTVCSYHVITTVISSLMPTHAHATAHTHSGASRQRLRGNRFQVVEPGTALKPSRSAEADHIKGQADTFRE